MKKCYFLTLFAALICGLQTYAQPDIIATLPIYQKCDTSIIRDWNNDYSIVYTQQPRNKNHFHLIRANDTTIISYLTTYTVKDMNISRDTLYFCGLSNTGNPVIGFFAISDFLTGGLQENIVPMPYPSAMANSNFTPKKIEPFHVSDGIHAIVLLDARFPTDSVKKVLCDCYRFYSSTTWAFYYGFYSTFDGGNNIFYCDDIAVTDNYVFLVGHKRCSAGIYMRFFNKPTNASFSIFNLPGPTIDYNDIYYYASPLGGNLNVLGDSYGEHSVYCTHTENDDVAIACMAHYLDGNTFTYGATVKLIGLTTTMNLYYDKDILIPYSSTLDSRWDVRDLRYDHRTKDILMLSDMNNPINGTLESVVTRVDYPNLSSATSVWPTLKTQLHSMDMFTHLPYGIAACGNLLVSSADFVICNNKSITASSCFPIFHHNLIRWNQSVINFFNVPVSFPFQQQSSIYTVIKPTPSHISILCSNAKNNNNN